MDWIRRSLAKSVTFSSGSVTNTALGLHLEQATKREEQVDRMG